MLTCTALVIPMVLFATAFLVRAAVGASFPGPAYPDSYYYVHVAEQLAAGHGLTSQYIWNFVDVGGQLPAVPTLPIPSNGHWMPLAAFVQVPFIMLFGNGALAEMLPFWIVGAAAAPITWWMGRDAGFDARPSFAAAVMVAAPAGLTPFLSQPDNFGLFMTLGVLSLWLCARGARGDRRAFALGGLVVGLAMLARSDGVLLGLPFALVLLRALVTGRERRATLIAAAACAALFAVVMTPWLLRQIDVFGTIAPSAANGRILWIKNYAELYSIGSAATPQTLFADGPGAFIGTRVSGLLSALGLFALLALAAVLAPLALAGAWVRRRDPTFAPFFVYAFALFAASALLFAVHVPKGTFIHSAVALLPHTFLLVTTGVGTLVAWVARHRATWDAPRATRLFTSAAVAVALMGAALQTITTVGHWRSARETQVELAAGLSDVPKSDRIMSADAGAYYYLTGHPGIVTPNDPLPVVESAMRAYDVRWLILERDAIVPALAPVLSGEVRPAWLSAPVAIVSGSSRSIASTTPMDQTVADGAVYAVCLSPADARCAQ
ncbi:MAG: glycosyltransferase family 39 protein [Candidatus Limnocylindrales bacterium]